MKQNEIFGSASWVKFSPDAVSVHAVKKFTAKKAEKAELFIIGLGFFEAYINGKEVTEDKFLPLNSEFHKREMFIRDTPFGEELAYRIYACRFDVTELIAEGENALAVMLGNGWYTRKEHDHPYGEKKLIFRLVLSYSDGTTEEILSDGSVLWNKGFVTEYCFANAQTQDFTDYDDSWILPDGNTSGFENAIPTDFPETNYMFSDCPADRICEVIEPKIIRSDIGKRTYDIGKNCSGTVVAELCGEKGEVVNISVSEEKNADNSVNKDFVWRQTNKFICDGKKRTVFTRYTWNNGRYIEIDGKAKLVCFRYIHCDTPVSSSFNSSDINIKWLYDAYITTQLSNMHAGIPSDCPHLERRGYTGDGELACDAAMTVLDARKFYKKWIGDISDCQDRISGHIQYTAPYVQSGGGPGGWGCAIVHVPYEYFKHYGDISLMKELYPQMLEYFRYLDDHSENGLITSDRKGEWCLGDWCTARRIAIPTPFVNNYFYIRSINEILECASLIGLSENEIKTLEDKKAYLIKVINDNYFDALTGDYAENIQGANAFALDLGLGDERALKHTVDYYSDLGMFDTGIFGTDILTRLLFEKGYPELAFELLSNEKMFSFGNLRLQGATTLWEYWTGRRSHSHPMFGAVAAYLFRYILGIRTDEKGLKEIAPLYVGKDADFEGSIDTLQGKISVKISYTGNKAAFEIDAPCDTVFKFNGETRNISKGKNTIEIG